jgi:hypothetical protein
LGGVSPRSGTIRSFDAYVSKTDASSGKSLSAGNFLWIDDLEPAARDAAFAKLKRGEVVLRRIVPTGPDSQIPGDTVHDWQGTVFIPGVRLHDVLALLEDYDRQSTYFGPDVEKSKIVEHSGNHYRAYLRFRRTKIITVVLNTDHDVKYFSDFCHARC